MQHSTPGITITRALDRQGCPLALLLLPPLLLLQDGTKPTPGRRGMAHFLTTGTLALNVGHRLGRNSMMRLTERLVDLWQTTLSSFRPTTNRVIQNSKRCTYKNCNRTRVHAVHVYVCSPCMSAPLRKHIMEPCSGSLAVVSTIFNYCVYVYLFMYATTTGSLRFWTP